MHAKYTQADVTQAYTERFALIYWFGAFIGFLQQGQKALRHEVRPLSWSVVALQILHCDVERSSVLQHHVSDNSSSIRIYIFSFTVLLEKQDFKCYATFAKTKIVPLISCSQSEHQNLLKNWVSFHLRENTLRMNRSHIFMVQKPRLLDTLLWISAGGF